MKPTPPSTYSKAISLLLALLVLVLSFLPAPHWQAVGICQGASWTARLAYPFFHVNPLHAAINAWCLLSVVFIYEVSCRRLLLAYALAVTIPVDTLSAILPLHTPAVGLSGPIFVLFGSISFEVRRVTYYQLSMAAYLLLGFLLPGVAAYVHLYCYLCGLIIALLNKPFHRHRLKPNH